jgi:chromosome segregation ATPase
MFEADTSGAQFEERLFQARLSLLNCQTENTALQDAVESRRAEIETVSFLNEDLLSSIYAAVTKTGLIAESEKLRITAENHELQKRVYELESTILLERGISTEYKLGHMKSLARANELAALLSEERAESYQKRTEKDMENNSKLESVSRRLSSVESHLRQIQSEKLSLEDELASLRARGQGLKDDSVLADFQSRVQSLRTDNFQLRKQIKQQAFDLSVREKEYQADIADFHKHQNSLSKEVHRVLQEVESLENQLSDSNITIRTLSEKCDLLVKEVSSGLCIRRELEAEIDFLGKSLGDQEDRTRRAEYKCSTNDADLNERINKLTQDYDEKVRMYAAALEDLEQRNRRLFMQLESQTCSMNFARADVENKTAEILRLETLLEQSELRAREANERSWMQANDLRRTIEMLENSKSLVIQSLKKSQLDISDIGAILENSEKEARRYEDLDDLCSHMRGELIEAQTIISLQRSIHGS